MSKPEGKKQKLKIEPKNEIVFKGPYDQVVTEFFTLKNPTDSTIAFKVKTTAPKRYCVRPNNGQIPPQKTVQVAVMLQPGDLSQEKHKHKFMIQSVIVPNNENDQQANIDELFKSASPLEIMDSKFKCVFLDYDGNVLEPSVTVSRVQTEQFSSSTSTTNTAQRDDDNSESNDDLVSNGGNTNGQQTGGAGHQELLSSITAGAGHQELLSSISAGAFSTAPKHDTYDSNDGDALIGSTNNGHFESGDSGPVPTAVSKHGSDQHVTSTNMNFENSTNLSNLSSNQEKNDTEITLKMAQEEIKKLREKLQEIQRYASKLAESDKMNISSSGGNRNTNNDNFLSLLQTDKLTQISALIVIVSFVVGLVFGKTLF